MFRVLSTITNTYEYFDHIVYAKNYCMKANGQIKNYLEGYIDNNYISIYNKYVVVSDKIEICNTKEEANKLKDIYVIKAPPMYAINIAKINENLYWKSYTNPLYD